MKRRTKYKRIPLLLIVFSVICALITTENVFAQGVSSSKIPPEQRGEKPPKRKPPLPSQIVGISPDPAKVLHLLPLDVEKLLEEDRAAGKGRPLRAGIHRPLNISPETHGEWFDIDNGKGSIWLFQIHAPSAAGISVHFTDAYLPKGAKIYVYSPSHTDKYAGHYKWGPEISTRIIGGDTVIVELAIPTPYDFSKPLFKIESIGHFYSLLKQGYSLKSGFTTQATSCHKGATCYPGWTS